jgi:(1->4)-alpha-D-glucan 1-alpha-D-glucosylmutase
VGAWPVELPRLLEYARKAAREAKLHTSWQSANAEYEAAIEAHLSRIFEHQELLARVAAFVGSLTPGFEANALAQTLLKVACPGVPDVYQGSELWDFSLVDPDNRRPVDYASRQRLLAELPELSAEQIWERRSSGLAKLHVLSEGLKLRGEIPECFGAQGAYQSLLAKGDRAERVLAFQRGQDVVAVTTLWWLRWGSDFTETTVTLPAGRWLNRLTKTEHGDSEHGDSECGDSECGLASLLGPFPVALLTRLKQAGE